MGFQEYLQEINSKIGSKEIKSSRNGVEVSVKYYAWRDVRVNARSESSISQDKVKQSVLQSLTEHGVSLKIYSEKLVLFVESDMFFKLYATFNKSKNLYRHNCVFRLNTLNGWTVVKYRTR